MTTREEDLQKILALKPFGESCTVFWFEESGGEVYRIWDMLFLFYIPLYGGEGNFEGAFKIDEVEKLVDLAYTWT